MHTARLATFGFLAWCGLFAGRAYAEQCEAPCLAYELSAAVENDFTRFGTPEPGTSNDLYPDIEAGLAYHPLDWLVFTGVLKAEPIEELPVGNWREFSDVGVYAEQLNASVLLDHLILTAGKIHPQFGLAYDVTPGLHGTDVAEGYELNERNGGNVAYRFDVLEIEHRINVSAFTVDRTLLSDSLLTSRGLSKLEDGGAGNNDGISSVAVSLDGCVGVAPADCYEMGDAGYELAGRWQTARGSNNDELGAVATVFKSLTLDEVDRITLLGEGAYFRDFEASDDNAAFLTAAVAWRHNDTTYSLAYGHETLFATDSANIQTDLIDVTVKQGLAEQYSLAGEIWSVAIGYTFSRDDGQNASTLGIRLEADIDGVHSLASSSADN
jgi:hypothetical protein